VPFVSHPIQTLYRWLRSPASDLEVREVYDTMTVDLLQPFRVDLVLLDGYRYRVTAPLLEAYPGCVLGVHEGDVTRRTPDGRPLYRGLHAVHDAVLSGERETRASLYLVTAELDQGPALLRSWPFPVSPMVADGRRLDASELLETYAFAHQEWMELTAFGPLMAQGLALLAEGRLERGDGRFLVDGRPAPLDLLPECSSAGSARHLRWAV
jgi:hypothetical protein